MLRFIVCYFLLFFGCLLSGILDIYFFEIPGYHRYANSLCRNECFENSEKDFLAFHHLDSVSHFSGIIILIFCFLVYRHQHFYYIHQRYINDIFWPFKTFILRLIIFIICSIPLIIGFVTKYLIDGWFRFLIEITMSCFFFLSYIFLCPLLLKVCQIDFPCDLFMTGYYIKSNKMEEQFKNLPLDFQDDYDTIYLLEKRRKFHIIKIFEENDTKYL